MENQVWGLSPFAHRSAVVPGTSVWWGARAIYKGREIDLLGDRMGTYDLLPSPTNTEIIGRLHLWLDTKGMPALRSLLLHSPEPLHPHENREVDVRGDGFILRANPRRSYGYLYMAAYACPEATDPTPKPTKAKRKSATKSKKIHY